MTLLRRFAGAATVGLGVSVTALATAQPRLVFDAARDCQAVETTSGVRYVPPCALPSLELSPAELPLPAALSWLPRKTVVLQDFSCSPLRPVFGRFSLSTAREGAPVMSVAGGGEPQRNEVEASVAAHWRLVGLDGLSGIQAFRPGCQWWLRALAHYPSPSHLRLLVEHHLRLERLLVALVPLTSPDTGYMLARAGLDSSIDFLSFFAEFAAPDPTFRPDLSQSLRDLSALRGALSQDCGAQALASFCSRALGAARDGLQQLISDNEEALQGLLQAARSGVAVLADNQAFAMEHTSLSELERRIQTVLSPQ